MERIDFTQIANAILLEVLFKEWAGENYELFSDGGTFPGIGTPREIFGQKFTNTLLAMKRLSTTVN